MAVIFISAIMWVGLGVGITVIVYEHLEMTTVIVIIIAIYVVFCLIVNFVALSRYAKTKIVR